MYTNERNYCNHILEIPCQISMVYTCVSTSSPNYRLLHKDRCWSRSMAGSRDGFTAEGFYYRSWGERFSSNLTFFFHHTRFLFLLIRNLSEDFHLKTSYPLGL